MKHNLLRFGVFELDLRAQELRRKGRKVRLRGQPLQVLALLLERAGEVVDREELRQRLWSADTFVDFDNGLNMAIRRLRQALGDSAESPTMIETLPRVGYRFIGTVEDQAHGIPLRPAEPETPPAEAPGLASEFGSRGVATAPKLSEEGPKPVLVSGPPVGMAPSTEVKRRYWRGWLLLLSAALVALADFDTLNWPTLIV